MTDKRRETYAQGWRLYPASFIGHHIQGALAMGAILSGATEYMVAGCVWTAVYISYQSESRHRKQDSPGLDIADYISGAGIGIVAVEALKLAGVLA